MQSTSSGVQWVVIFSVFIATLLFSAAPFCSLFSGLFHTIRFTFNGDDFTVMHQPVDQRDNTSGIGEDFIPFTERTVGGHQRGTLLITLIDDFKQKISMAVTVREITELIDN